MQQNSNSKYLRFDHVEFKDPGCGRWNSALELVAVFFCEPYLSKFVSLISFAQFCSSRNRSFASNLYKTLLSIFAYTRVYAIQGILHALSLKGGSFLRELVTVSKLKKFLKNDVAYIWNSLMRGKTGLLQYFVTKAW
jgi:hypothetical protein